MELNNDIKKCIDRKYTTILIYKHCDRKTVLLLKKYSGNILSISYRKLKSINLKIIYAIDINYIDNYTRLELNNYIKTLYYIINNDISYFNKSSYNTSNSFIIKLFKNITIQNNKIELKVMINEYESFNDYTNYIIESIIKLKYNKHIINHKISISNEQFIYTGIFELKLNN